MISQSSQTQQLDGKQVFQKVNIYTPLQQKQLTNVTYKKVQQALMKNIQKLLSSQNYTHFDVYFGAQNLSNRSYLQQKYKRQQQILKLQIQQTKKKIFELSRTNDQSQFDNVMKNYLKNMKFINDRKQQVDHVDFIPIIYIKAEKKRPFYGQLNQQFNRKGNGIFKVKIGYRSPFLQLDKLQFNFQSPLANLRRKYFNIDLQWKNNHDLYGNMFAKISHGNESIFKDIDQQSSAFNIGLDKPQQNIRLQWQNKFRIPSIHHHYDQFIKKNYHLPSFKSSFKLTKVWQDSIQFNDINMGSYLQTKAQVTVPFLSKAQFGKVELNYRKFYDALVFKQYFNSQLMKKILYGSSFQTNFRWNVMKPFINKYVSDLNQNMDIRGFQQPKIPVQSYSNMKFSGKINFHNYPLIGQARITPFLYGQAGLSLLDMSGQKRMTPINPTQLYGAGSLGLGLSFYVNKFAQIQLVYNLLGYQNIARLTESIFQIRIGIFD